MKKNIIIAGGANSGKTAAVKEIARTCPGVCGGFYTERWSSDEPGRGFRVKTLDGKTAALASKNAGDLDGGARIAKLKKYKIDLNAIDDVAVAACAASAMAGLAVCADEIGSMTILSEKFRAAIIELMGENAPPLVATVRLNSRPYADFVKNRRDCVVFDLSRTPPQKAVPAIRRLLLNLSRN